MRRASFAILAAGTLALAAAGCGDQPTSSVSDPSQGAAPYSDDVILRGDVGDFVWFDQNDNGLQDDGPMSGVNGVDVVIECRLLTDGSLWTMTFTTTNDPQGGLPGWYNFNAVPAGSCMAYVDPATVPPDLMISSQPCGGPLEFFIGPGNTGNNNKAVDFCLVAVPAMCFDTQVAFAFGGQAATCFLTIDEDGDNVRDFHRWGWTNAVSPGTYSWPLFADAMHCDRSRGQRVGTVTVDYDGSTAVVTLETDPATGRTMASAHVYVGEEILPRDMGGAFTVSPRLYPMGDDFAACTPASGTRGDPFVCDGPGATLQTYTFTGLSGDVYVVAHAVTMGEVSCP
jgi:hypothetical protein